MGQRCYIDSESGKSCPCVHDFLQGIQLLGFAATLTRFNN